LVQGADKNSLQRNAHSKTNKRKMKRRLQSTMRSSNGLQETVKMKQKVISHGEETNTRAG
jgi:hypothetical protein